MAEQESVASLIARHPILPLNQLKKFCGLSGEQTNKTLSYWMPQKDLTEFDKTMLSEGCLPCIVKAECNEEPLIPITERAFKTLMSNETTPFDSLKALSHILDILQLGKLVAFTAASKKGDIYLSCDYDDIIKYAFGDCGPTIPASESKPHLYILAKPTTIYIFCKTFGVNPQQIQKFSDKVCDAIVCLIKHVPHYKQLIYGNLPQQKPDVRLDLIKEVTTLFTEVNQSFKRIMDKLTLEKDNK